MRKGNFLKAMTTKVVDRARMGRYSSKVREMLRDSSDKQLPAFAWPGGYTIIYLTKKDEVVCAKCANDPIAHDIHVQDYGSYDEGPDTTCDVCEASIESSYGDPDAEKKNVEDSKGVES